MNNDETRFGELYDYDCEKLFPKENDGIYIGGKDSPECFARHWDRGFLAEDMRKYLRGKIVIDLGGGIAEKGDTVMSYIFREHDVGVDWYLSIDKHNYGHDFDQDIEKKSTNEMVVTEIQMDMREALECMLSDTQGVCFIINGIDTCIIRDRRYHEAIADHVSRVMTPGNAILTAGSEEITGHWNSWISDYSIEKAPEYKAADHRIAPVIWVKK